MIAFFVPGIPIPQGSHAKSRFGGIYDSNKGLQSWRQDVIAKASQAGDDYEPITGPVKVIMTCWFPRLKSHYRTGRNAHLVKDTAPNWHTTKPDTDKLQRALGDALTYAAVIKDDSQICVWESSKAYCNSQPGMHVELIPLEDIEPINTGEAS